MHLRPTRTCIDAHFLFRWVHQFDAFECEQAMMAWIFIVLLALRDVFIFDSEQLQYLLRIFCGAFDWYLEWWLPRVGLSGWLLHLMIVPMRGDFPCLTLVSHIASARDPIHETCPARRSLSGDFCSQWICPQIRSLYPSLYFQVIWIWTWDSVLLILALVWYA